MLLGRLICATGRHKVNAGAIRRVNGMAMTRCRRCNAPLEQLGCEGWRRQETHHADLGYTRLN